VIEQAAPVRDGQSPGDEDKGLEQLDDRAIEREHVHRIDEHDRDDKDGEAKNTNGMPASLSLTGRHPAYPLPPCRP